MTGRSCHEAKIKGTNGLSSGVILLNVGNATAIAVNQGGKRQGAVCGYLGHGILICGFLGIAPKHWG